MDEDNAIELKGVSVRYPINVITKTESKRKKKKEENVVLDNIDFTVKKGEIVGIIGLNGSDDVFICRGSLRRRKRRRPFGLNWAVHR